MANQNNNSVGNQAYSRSGFWHGFFTVGRRSICNWTLYTSIFLSIFVILSSKSNFSKIHKVMADRAMDLFNCSVGAISMILAAIAIVVVIYNKRDFHIIVTGSKKTAEGFIFPYQYGATLWALLALISFLYVFLPITNNIILFCVTNFLWLFLAIYCVIFTLNLIREIIQHMLLSGIVEEK